MKTANNAKTAIAVLLSCTVCTVSGFVCGHATALHQHADMDYLLKLANGYGDLSYSKYFKNMVKDYKNMLKDPLGLERSLE